MPESMTRRRPTAIPRRPATGLRGRDFLLLLAATVGTFSNYAPMLSVASLWSAEGGSGHGGVGAVTGVTMATTVGVQLVMRRLLRRYGARRLLASGALLLGLPTFAYALSSELAWVLGVSAVRGVGFGIVAVAGSALVAELVAASQRGRAVGWYGVAVGLPQVLFLPLGVWSVQQVGFVGMFLVSGALSVLAAPLAWMMSGRRVQDEGPARVTASAPGAAPRLPLPLATQLRGLVSPWAAMIVAACALGGVTSFLPLALAGEAVAPFALLLLSAGVIVGRWGAGVLNDRRGAPCFLVGGVLGCALGSGGLALAVAVVPGEAVVALTAATVYGLSFGALQNDTLVVMFRRCGRDGHGTASAVWNIAYDAGTGVGAVAVGLVSPSLGVSGALAAVALLILGTAPLAWRDSSAERGGVGPRCRVAR